MPLNVRKMSLSDALLHRCQSEVVVVGLVLHAVGFAGLHATARGISHTAVCRIKMEDGIGAWVEFPGVVSLHQVFLGIGDGTE